MQAVKKLPGKLRQVFILKEMNNLSYGDIGAILKLSEGTVKSRMHRAVKKLRQILATIIPVSASKRGES